MVALSAALRALVETLDWRAGVDVAFVALGIFVLYHTLRATGTWKILFGLLLAMGVFVCASLLDLQGVEWIYSNLSQVALLGLIVVFQPELRKVLEAAASLRSGVAPREAPRLAGVLAEAAFALARQRRGGILVVPGKRSITQWTSPGIPLGAEPSVPLLLSLFDPHSPGHDGAVVIEDGKVSCFSVRLPLSNTGTLPEISGTRHHAALGLAEATDALVIAISEERGAVTTFALGIPSQVPDTDALSARIAAHWKRNQSVGFASARGKSARVLAGEVLLSVGIAAVFWAAVVIGGSDVREEALSVPVEYTNLPPQTVLAGEPAAEARVYLAGPETELEKIDRQGLHVRVDLSGAQVGTQTIPVTQDQLDLPRRVTLAKADPGSLEVELAGMQAKELPVVPQLVGSPPPGLQVTAVEVSPEHLKVVAPDVRRGKSVARRLTTTPIYLDHILQKTTLLCQIIAPAGIRPQGGGGWPNAQVTISVAPPPVPAPKRR